MTITVKHTKVSTVPDTADTSLVRPSDWNADHTLTGLGTAAELDAGVPNGVATLDSSGKVPTSQIPLQGDLNYQGTWNASTNTPTLTSSVGTQGYYYVVDVAGSTNLNGITDWKVGDWAIYNGSVWQKVDNTDAVTSVNGQVGTVVLTTTNIAEGTNEYFTQARARQSLSAGTGISYDNTTGVITNSSPSLGGDVVGPSSATDNAVARYDSTTGKLLQNSVVTVGDTGAVAGVTTLTASTKVVSPYFDASSSAGGALRNASGTPQLQWGGGGGNNITFDVATNLNPANSQIDISPTGTGTVRINPATASSMNNVVIGATTPLAITGTTITGTSFVGSGASLTNVVNSLTASTGISVSGSTGAVTVTNTAPDQVVSLTAGTNIGISGTYPNFTINNTSSGTGTVTSVGTGTGLTGGPITTTGTISLADTTVTAGSYTYASITVDAQGRLTAASSGSSPSAFPSGTAVLFAQTAAPTGWTKSTTHNDKALRVVSGTASSGGSVAFSTAFASQTPTGSVSVSVNAGTLAVGVGTLAVGNTTATGTISISGGAVSAYTLTSSDIPSHSHNLTLPVWGGCAGFTSWGQRSASTPTSTQTTATTGGGGSHTHSFTQPTGSFSGTAHNHTLSGSPSLSGSPAVSSASFSGNAINLAVQYVDVIIATKD